MKSGIYTIRNTENNKVYVGSSVNLKSRWITHKSYLQKGEHHNAHLQNAWGKYGEKNFVFEIIERCVEEDLIAREQYWMDKLDVENKGYNIRLVAESNRGLEFTEEHKKRISEAHKGRKLSKEHKEKLRQAKLGKKQSKEQRDAILKGRLASGYTHSEETKQKIAEAHKGKKLSKEHIAKMAEVAKGRPAWNKGLKGWNKGHEVSEETRKKIALKSKGRKHTKETRKKISEIQKGKKLKESTKLKISQAMKAYRQSLLTQIT